MLVGATALLALVRVPASVLVFGLLAATLAILVAAQRRLEPEMLEPRASFEAQVEQIPAVTYVYSIRQSRLAYISPQSRELFGFDVDDWVAHRPLWRRQVHPEDRRYVFAVRDRCGRSGEALDAEYRMLTSAGQVVWVHDRAVVLRDEAGIPLEIQGVMLDVSERKRIEEALRASESRYRALVEASPDAVVVTDLEGRTLMGNHRLARLLGVDGETRLAGRLAADFAVAEDRDRIAGWIGQVRSTGAVSGVEFSIVTEAGRRLPADLSLAAITDGEGVPLAIVGVIRDLSQRRRVEEGLRESQAKSRFLATMSHELRTPLNSILGFAQLLAGAEFGPLNPRQDRYVENIRASGRHLLELVNDVLDLAEARDGDLTVRLEPVSVRALMVHSLDRVRNLAEAKSMRLELERGPDLRVRADWARLAQVMSNLLTNAVKFTPPGGLVTIQLKQDGSQVAITVRDNGIGIPPEEQVRIFDQFVQVEGGRTRPQEGTGLGLALSRELVQLMSGTISLQSEVGTGSAFTVCLPLFADAVEPPARSGAEERSSAGSPTRGRG
jgi:PAS domain S-box-containing protein